MNKNFIGKMFADMAFLISMQSANSVCGFFFYQPELPDKVKKMRRR